MEGLWGRGGGEWEGESSRLGIRSYKLEHFSCKTITLFIVGRFLMQFTVLFISLFIQLPLGKFQLTNQDSAGEKNFTDIKLTGKVLKSGNFCHWRWH